MAVSSSAPVMRRAHSSRNCVRFCRRCATSSRNSAALDSGGLESLDRGRFSLRLMICFMATSCLIDDSNTISPGGVDSNTISPREYRVNPDLGNGVKPGFEGRVLPHIHFVVFCFTAPFGFRVDGLSLPVARS